LNAPPEINSKGAHGDFDTVVLEVRICRQRSTGATWSVHDLQDASDTQLVQSWPGWGTREIATSLLLEAVRRTVYSFILSYLNETDPDFLGQYRSSSGETRQELETRLEGLIIDATQRLLKRMLPGALREVLAMLTSQISAHPR